MQDDCAKLKIIIESFVPLRIDSVAKFPIKVAKHSNTSTLTTNNNYKNNNDNKDIDN